MIALVIGLLYGVFGMLVVIFVDKRNAWKVIQGFHERLEKANKKHLAAMEKLARERVEEIKLWDRDEPAGGHACFLDAAERYRLPAMMPLGGKNWEDKFVALTQGYDGVVVSFYAESTQLSETHFPNVFLAKKPEPSHE